MIARNELIGDSLRVLVACEHSGAVRDAFAARGHYARSVDLLPTESLPETVRGRGEYSCFDCAIHGRVEGCEECEYGEPWCHLHGMDAWECPCIGPTEDEAEYTDDGERGARHLTGDLFTVEDIESYDLLIAHPPCTHLAVSGARWLTRHWVTKKSHSQRGYWHDPAEKLKAQAEAVEFAKRIMALPVERIGMENPISRLSTLFRKPDQIIQPWQFGHGETKATCLWLKNLPKLKPTNIVAGRDNRIHRLPPSPDRWKERSKTFPGIAAAMAQQWGSSQVLKSSNLFAGVTS
jgi:hypothetical protein